jgi:branched-chain amino acid transport system permease protein
MVDPVIFASALVNGLLTGGVYALVALGLTLIYGVLHVVNFAHGALLMVGLYLSWLLATRAGIDPYVAAPLVTLLMFAIGWALYQGVIAPVSGGEDRRLLLATLGASIVLENGALMLFAGDTRSVEMSYSFSMLEAGPLSVPLAKVASFAAALAMAAALWAFMTRTSAGLAIRAVAKEPEGARLVGIRPQRIFALAYAVGIGCLGAAACLLLPSYYVNPGVGGVFVLVAFTIVVLGGMGSFPGAFLGGLLVGAAESLGGLWLGESLGPILVPLVFIAVLLWRPTGLFGAAR